MRYRCGLKKSVIKQQIKFVLDEVFDDGNNLRCTSLGQFWKYNSRYRKLMPGKTAVKLKSEIVNPAS